MQACMFARPIKHRTATEHNVAQTELESHEHRDPTETAPENCSRQSEQQTPADVQTKGSLEHLELSCNDLIGVHYALN